MPFLKKNLYWTIVVALSGFLFGFDTVVISGANEPVKQLWDTSPLFHGVFIMSMALWGTVVGALFGGWPSSRYGYKPTLIWIGVLYLVSALGSALANDPYLFSFFRFIGGLGVGASSVAAPAFITEISRAEERGKYVAAYQLNIVLGVFIAYVSNYLLSGFQGASDWRWMLGIEALPAVVFVIMVSGIPESPRWLVLIKKDVQKAIQVLKQIYSAEESEKVLKEIQSSADVRIKSDKPRFQELLKQEYKKPLMLAFFIAFFNQWSGINFILYYAPELFKNFYLLNSVAETGQALSQAALKSSISLGAVNLIFTLVGMYFIDRLGRKQLLIVGGAGYIISLLGVAFAFYSDSSDTFLMICFCAFIASHAVGQGAVIWVMISEFFPNRLRSFGQAFGSGVHWVFAAIIVLITPIFLDEEEGYFGDNPWPIFAFFAIMMMVQLIWIWRKVPETKGKTLEQISKEI
jgi:SP family xylose:H+ symportor-like MFS transporter